MCSSTESDTFMSIEWHENCFNVGERDLLSIMVEPDFFTIIFFKSDSCNKRKYFITGVSQVNKLGVFPNLGFYA